jgi:RNA polymerase sigma factor (sigma-70 family)
VSRIKAPVFSKISRAAVTGTPQEFSVLLKSLEPHLRAIAFHNLRSGIDLDDLEQAGRIALWRSTARFDARRGAFINYARRAVKNAIRTEIQRARRVSEGGGPPNQPKGDIAEGIENHCDLPDSLDLFAILRVRRWLETLPLTLRNLFALIYRNGLSQRDAARILRVSQPRVAQLHTELLRRGREALAELAA